MNDENKKILEMLQESHQRERKQMRQMLIITLGFLGIVTVAFLVIGALWLKSQRGDDTAKRRNDETTNPNAVTTTPVKEATAATKPAATQSSPVKETAIAEKPVEASNPPPARETAVAAVTNAPPPPGPDPRSAIKRHPANEPVTMALPARVENPAKIPGYKDSRIMLVTERGVALPWLIVVPEQPAEF